MDTHDLYLGTQYVVLGAAVGTYGAVTGRTWIQAPGAIVMLASIWYLSRAAVRLYRDVCDSPIQPTNYNVMHYCGVWLASLGVLGVIQLQADWINASIAVPILAVGIGAIVTTYIDQ